jgi:hypothetical protein
MSMIPQDTPQGNLVPKTTFIYVLIDPETQEIRYVGKANNLRGRLSKHLRQTDDTYKQRWIHDLQSRGLKPVIQAIEEVSIGLWPERERYWIDYYRAQGCHLTNTARGGLGGGPSPEGRAKLVAINTGKKHTPEARAKIQAIADTRRGIKRPPEVGAKVSAARTGMKRKPFHRDNGWTGRKKKPESIALMIATRKRTLAMKKYPPDAPGLWS